MPVIARIRSGEYFDSVSLMVVGKKLAALPGVKDAAVVMGTAENKAILKASGLLAPELQKAGDTDLLISISAKDRKAADMAHGQVDAELKALKAGKGSSSAERRPRSLEGALQALPGANLSLISVAGRYAGAEAMKALRAGLHVMLFSDNVPVEEEVRLKRFAAEKGLLVMGPDCGTAIINGAPLAFANVVRRGGIGVVGASGTGTQEVTCVVSNEGAGVSQAVGTGGRDVKEKVGGIMFLEGLKALARDPDTTVILLVSKPPHRSVLERIGKEVKKIRKPVVAVFLGADPASLKGCGILGAATLEEAALLAAGLAKGGKTADVKKRLKEQDKRIAAAARKLSSKCRQGSRFVRGLYSGGTFCTEAQLILQEVFSPVYANEPTGKAKKLADSLKSTGHTVVDLGADEFTLGRPHPMIDYTLRNKRILAEASDPDTAVVLLDVVLGYGSNMKPAEELVPVVREAAGKTAVVATVTGTEGDPQGKAAVESALEAAGAALMPANAAACRLAAETARLASKTRVKA